ncbi:MAG: PilW family protein [Proteobacteria bacterium]|nr:PilW family protein [Pseudomonadota bacterium]
MKTLNPKHSVGLSLIELLIAMVLGLTLASGVLQIYASSSATERSQDARLRMQEGGRFALNFLGNEIRMAGYLGCLGSMQGSGANNTLNAPPNTLQPGTGIQGWEAAGTNPGVVNNSANDVATVASTTAEWTTGGVGFNIPTVQAVPNSDILRLWGGAGDAGAVISIDNTGGDPIVAAEAAIGIAVNDFLIISDCEQVDFVQACAVAPTGGGASTVDITLSTACNPGNLATAFVTSVAPAGSPAEVIRLEGVLYYVGKRDDTATNPPSLYRAVLDTDGTLAAPEEIIEGVESMQLLYGVNVDQDVRATVDAYLPADLVTNWDEVISVRVSLLMQSIEDGTTSEPQAYTFDGVTYSAAGGGGSLPQDRRARRIFTSTISLRNRALGT